MRGVPGRKTDVLDCQWLRQLHACGLLKGCFLPDDQTSALRNLQRMRHTLREAAGQAVAAVVPPHPSDEKGRRMIKRGEEPMRQASG